MPKILIADDEPHIRLLLSQTLEELEEKGVGLLIAANGEDALEMINAERPELVFLDVMMPRMNGLDVCDVVKNVLGLKNIFIVMLTAEGQEFDKQRAKDAGADIYMTKPFNPDEIVTKAAKVLGVEL